MRCTHRRLLSVLLLSASAAVAAEPARIAIDLTQPGPAINPRMFGIFLEEINHGVDGGLYAELIRNRGFEDARPPEGYTYTVRNGRGTQRDAHGFDSGFSRYGYTTNGAPFWSPVKQGSADGSMHLETTGVITSESAYCLRLDIESTADGRVGVLRISFLKTLQAVRGLWQFLQVASDLLTVDEIRLVVRRTLREIADMAIPKRRARSCPWALRQPVSSWPRLRRNTYRRGPVEYSVNHPTTPNS